MHEVDGPRGDDAACILSNLHAFKLDDLQSKVSYLHEQGEGQE